MPQNESYLINSEFAIQKLALSTIQSELLAMAKFFT